MSAKQTLKRLLTEVKLASPNGSNKDSLIARYIVNQFEKYQTTDQQLCKAKEEMHFMGKTYLCYLQSLRKYQEINTMYKGRGERTVEDTANLVGFKLPHDPK
jgi:hypothetical protein